MANAQIWPGSSSFVALSASWYDSGSPPRPTPFGYYDNDPQFQTDSDKVAYYCANRLGYPITDVELQQINFYAAFEMAVTTYGNEVYAYKVKQDYLSMEGASTASFLNNTVITPNFAGMVRISQQYGEEAGVGGDIPWYKGELTLEVGKQDYDMTAWAAASASLQPGDSIEIKRIFYQPPPAISQLYAPNLFMPGLGGVPAAAGLYGWGGYANYMLMPTSFIIQNVQSVEMQNTVLFNNYSFELTDNILRIFPVPGSNQGEEWGYYRHKLWFDYIKNSERNSPYQSGSLNNPVMSNVSNAPYTNPTYYLINSIGRAWIFEYTLAIAKEMLGLNRGKYQTVPIPGDQVTLNHADLISQARDEKTALLEKLKGYLEETSRDKLLEKKANEADYLQKEMNLVPYLIYIG